MFRLIVLLLHLLLLFHGCWSNRPTPNKLLTIQTNCTRDLFQINVNMEKSFKGIIFAKDFVDDCRSKGNLNFIFYYTYVYIYRLYCMCKCV